MSKLLVAILSTDQSIIAELNEIFKVVGASTKFYSSLQDFWTGTLENMPSLAVVDVALMSQGDLIFKAHPYIKAEEMPVVFIFSEKNRPLVFSTFDILNLGLIKKEDGIKGQMKSVLKRFNKFSEYENVISNLKIENGKLDRQITGTIADIEKRKEMDHYQAVLEKMVREFETRKGEAELSILCDQVFSLFSEIKQFTFFELAQNGQKLTTPLIKDSSKYRHVPSLWLGETCTKGIEFFAQNMANQMSVELIGGEIVALAIRGKFVNPDKLLYVKAKDESILNNFPWDKLEKFLCDFYLYGQYLDSKNSAMEVNQISPWEMMGTLDKLFFGHLPGSRQKQEDLVLVDISFQKLISVIRSTKVGRFYWEAFFNSFVARLKNQIPFDFKVTTIGVDHIGVLAGKNYADDLFALTKATVAKFSYWRYFEDVDLAVTKDVRPDVQMIPLASEAYLQYIEGRSIFSKKDETSNVQRTSTTSASKGSGVERVNEI